MEFIGFWHSTIDNSQSSIGKGFGDEVVHGHDQFAEPFAAQRTFGQCYGNVTAAVVFDDGAVGVILFPGT